jgi:hypothetical protein
MGIHCKRWWWYSSVYHIVWYNDDYHMHIWFQSIKQYRWIPAKHNPFLVRHCHVWFEHDNGTKKEVRRSSLHQHVLDIWKTLPLMSQVSMMYMCLQCIPLLTLLLVRVGHNRQNDCEPNCVAIGGKWLVDLTNPHIEDASNTHLHFQQVPGY